ncbi:PROX1 [Fasciola gigantica]|uniref:PROX1 n=1 Tax=Fasciola gigantica TaxID=46835 RepID=A0A504Y935_FASGI|nr:PROX1 [Fasciola gigantica]
MSTSQPGVSSAAAAAAILTAFGLTSNPFWVARRPVSSDFRLPPWIPGYSPNLLQWASENLASIGSNSTNVIDSQPMTNVPQFTMGPSFPGLGNSNVMDLTSSLPNSVNSIGLSVDEQTEALPLVVRGMRKDADNNQIGRFTPDELCTPANESKFGSITITSAGYSPGTVMNYQGGLLSRRKRTKVTDTRMSSRGPRAVHCVALRTNSALNATACTGFGFFKSAEEKNFPTKTPNAVNMLAECPTSTTSSLGRMFKSDNTDRPTSDMIPSPTNLTEVRLNSSSSSPSPSSIRLSGGSHEQMDGDSGRLLFNRNTLPTGFYSPNQIHNVQVAIRHGMGSIANLMNKERHNTEADTFEQVLAKTFHSCPLTKRSLDSTGKSSSSQLNALFDSTMTSTSSSQTLETAPGPTRAKKSSENWWANAKPRPATDLELDAQHLAKLEFYYIQMEKFARVAISEGIRSAEQIHVTTDSELYRALNLHYNRNQQLDVPQHFRIVVEATLREFFNALMTGKDSEQSWKKPIYKIIARMDQPVPEFFKNSNWMEQLADG